MANASKGAREPPWMSHLVLSPSDSRRVRVDGAQAESSSDGSVHAGAPFRQDLKAEGSALSRIRRHGALVEDLERNESASERRKKTQKKEGGDLLPP